MDSSLASASPKGGWPVLQNLPWVSARTETLTRLGALLSGAEFSASTVGQWLGRLDESEAQACIDRSVERPSHYKWFLGQESGATVWLHQYKDDFPVLSPGNYAASVHDHRYGFASRILQGSLHIQNFRKTGESRVEFHSESQLAAGHVYAVEPDDVHAVVGVAASTFTLLIQSLPVRSYSTIYDTLKNTSRRAYDLKSLYPRLATVLTEGRSPGAIPS